MKHCKIVTAIVFGLLFVHTTTFASAENVDAVHLFLLSGQSNMANMNPEQFFNPEIQKHFGSENVVIVKVAQKGQPIRRWYKDWKVTGNQNPAQIGDIYERLMKAAKEKLNDKPIKSVTLIWMQGERDAKEGLAAHYEESFRGLLEQIKQDLGVAQINYIIGRLSDSGVGTKDWDQIRLVQERLGDAGPHSSWVNTDDLNDDGQKRNDLHYSAKGYQLLAERYAKKAIELLSNSEPKGQR